MGGRIESPGENKNLYDVVVIGGGPAGLTAALYLARACYRVVVLEKETFGGQITITSEVVNYPGVFKTDGKELTENMRRQAERFGAEFLLAEAEEILPDGDVKKVVTGRGTLSCFGVLLATGAHPRMVGFAGEEEFKGHGVAYCATCDGEFFTGREVFVVGGGFAAAEESVFLTKYASHVTILVREEDFTCAKAVADEAKKHEKITVITDTEVEEVSGDTALRYIRYKNLKTGETTEYQVNEGDYFGVFVFAGYEPATSLVKDFGVLNENGYVITDGAQKTSVDGLYAAGDVCVKNLRQVVTAVGDGALAATELERYAAAMQKKTGQKPVRKEPHTDDVPRKPQEEKDSGKLFDGEMLKQLQTVFSKMEHKLVLKVYMDARVVSEELKRFMEQLAGLTEQLSLEIAEEEAEDAPCVRVCREDGTWTGLAFHGVPGGHEFTSFVMGLYNAAGPGQELEPELKERIHAISHPVHMKIMVSLTCTMCPELVISAQKIAAENPQVTAEVYDLNHFQELKEKYQVMSVPCMVMGDGKAFFGKKNVRQLLGLIAGA